ncbi:lipoprotein [Salinispirillum sp. LH 10-3-1]|uniref:Lipoprotein n=1 Tax=Salinispirillum sp. LH 10-3-1 TaxID=2952525 RepID=A0AB38YG60_9GAMM
MRGLLIVLLSLVLLSACGYKTDLTLPEPTPPSSTS